jgi:hypothetical protein
MACLDAAAGETERYREMHKSPYKSEYETACDAVRRAYPQLVHDMARAQNPDAWAEHKLGKLGHKPPSLPQPRGQREQSGEEPPTETSGRGGIPAPQWEFGAQRCRGDDTCTRGHEAVGRSDSQVVGLGQADI